MKGGNLWISFMLESEPTMFDWPAKMNTFRGSLDSSPFVISWDVKRLEMNTRWQCMILVIFMLSMN